MLEVERRARGRSACQRESSELEGDPWRESGVLEGERRAGGRSACWREIGVLEGDLLEVYLIIYII